MVRMDGCAVQIIPVRLEIRRSATLALPSDSNKKIEATTIPPYHNALEVHHLCFFIFRYILLAGCSCTLCGVSTVRCGSSSPELFFFAGP